MGELQKICIVSQNVRGLRDAVKRKKLMVYFKKIDVDVILLQETHSVQSDEAQWHREWGSTNIFFSHGTNQSGGVATLIKPKCYCEAKVHHSQHEGRSLVIELNIKGINLCLANLYAPNVDDPVFFQTMDTCLLTDKVIGGDFNLVINPNIDCLHSTYNNYNAAAKVISYVESGYSDIWREKYPDLRQYTWQRSKNKNRSAARIDFWLVSDDLRTRIENVLHKPGISSDHSQIYLEIRTDLPKRGRGLWKLNSSYLKHDEYKKGLLYVVQKAKIKYKLNNPALRWELIKTKIIVFSQMYAFQIAKLKKEQLNSFECTINYLESQLEKTGEAIFSKELEEVKGKYEIALQQEAERALFHSKARYHIEGERPTKYFFNLAKTRYMNRVMYEITDERGQLVTNPNEILNVQYQYYKKLYTANPKAKFSLTNCTERKITAEQHALFEENLTKEELRKAVFHFKDDKTPGVDGIVAAFYKQNWDLIVDLLYESYQYCYQVNQLHISGRCGVLSLIPKKGRDIIQIKNWHPLMMLTIDYKILSKVLDNRLKTVLPNLIQEHQTGFMEGHNILTNIVKLLEIMSETQRKSIVGLIMSIDFEKCFDMIEHQAICGALEYFGFGPNYIRWVMLLFNKFELCSQNNGYISNWWSSSRGCHQGCYISPHLFILNWADVF